MATWMTTITRNRGPAARYRVEHHDGDTIRSLGIVVDVPMHHTSLEPFVSALLLSGEVGYLLLIDEATGAVVARRRVCPYGAKSGDRYRHCHN